MTQRAEDPGDTQGTTMADIITILLAFISIGVTIVGGLVSWVVLKLLQLDGKLQTLWDDYFGVDAANGHGFREEVADDQDSMRAMLVQAKLKHETFEEFLADLSDYLDRNEEGDPPHIEDGYELDD